VSSEIGLLRLRTLVRVWCKRTDVNQADNAIVGSSAGDDGSAVGVADKDNRAADPADGCFCYGDVLCGGIEAVLRRNASYPSACKGTINLLKQEPSAQSPWQNTMLGLVCVDVISKSPYRETSANGEGNRSTDCSWVHSERPGDDTPFEGKPGTDVRFHSFSHE
jgi:hypothetical protein